MFNLKPKYYNIALEKFQNIDEIDQKYFDEINSNLLKNTSKNPEVSIVIAAWNEELNIIKCIDTLSRQESKFSYEIIVVDNNSDDRTQESVKKMYVTYLFEKKQGCGPARQQGQEYAKGKYILLADADCIYPIKWVETLTFSLKKKGVVCVYGNYSFITDNYSQKLGMMLYEFARNIISSVRHINRPFLNCLGMSMGYIKEYGLEIGYIDKNIRGDDGRLAYSLMEYGKIKRVFNTRSTVWTGYRTIVRKGSILNAFFTRLKEEFLNIADYSKKIEDHDPKNTLSEENPSAFLAKNDQN